MKLSRDNQVELVNNLFWDMNVEIDYILKLLEGGAERHPKDKINLYLRLLTSCDWYTLLKLMPIDLLKREVLADTVINRLFPPALREKYKYARSVLSG